MPGACAWVNTSELSDDDYLRGVRGRDEEKLGRGMNVGLAQLYLKRVGFCFLLLATSVVAHAQTVRGVDSVGITVMNMQRSLDFYTKVLPFEPVSDVEVTGEAYEHLMGVFGLRMRVVRLRLCE